MAVVELFSKLQKRARGEVPDVYRYDQIPSALREQIIFVLLEQLGQKRQYTLGFPMYARTAFIQIVSTLRREYGMTRLCDTGLSDPFHDELLGFIRRESDVERVLDAVHLVVQSIAQHCPRIQADRAVEEINARFREHGVGFRFENGEVVRADSELLHREVTQPALSLLAQSHFKGANEEFLSAHEHHRHGRHKEALNDALKACESTIKAICDRRGWGYAKDATSKELIGTCFKRGLIPDFWQSQMGGLRALLENGVPTGRNRLSGHGQGSDPIDVPQHIVGYVLHMTAAAIVFLGQADEAGK